MWDIKLRGFAESASVCFEVRDEGVGMSRRVTKRIFDRFYQADQNLSRRAGGCGLGLSITRFILDAHGGRIEVVSRPGQGSTFTVTLPAAGNNG
jgi:signal transduction histidine kinase